MKKSLVFFFVVLLLCACSPQVSVSGDLERGDAERSDVNPYSRGNSFVKSQASALLAEIVGEDVEGEAAVRVIYNHLISRVYFADPIGLDVWRYLSDEESIPFLENRALSPFLFEVGSCEDFAAAMVLLLDAAGYEAEYVAGFTLSVKGEYIDHAWVVVRLGENWYHIDPQLEQNVTRNHMLNYRYYLKSDADFVIDHKWGENLIAYWSNMPQSEKDLIRSEYTYATCAESYPTPSAISTPLPPSPNLAELEGEIDRIKRESGKGHLAPIPLNVEPPILVAAHHITPPLILPVASDFRYGRSFLQGQERDFYDLLALAAENGRDGAATPLPSGMSETRANYIAKTFLGDHPEYYYIAFDTRLADNNVQMVCNLTLATDKITLRQQELDTYAAEKLATIAGATPFEKALFIHDTLAAIPYDHKEQADCANIYGTLIGGTANCDGYARSFHYLAKRAGLDAVYLRGRSFRGISHAWNAVQLDDGWYFVDATWDHPLRKQDDVYHDYFLMDTDEMLLERFWDDDQYPELPQPPDEPRGYYRRMGYAISGEVSDGGTTELAELLCRQLVAKGNWPTQPTTQFLEIKIEGTEAEYLQWKRFYVKEIFAILRAMNEIAEREQLPFAITDLESVKCDFNDSTQIFTFYPTVKRKEA